MTITHTCTVFLVPCRIATVVAVTTGTLQYRAVEAVAAMYSYITYYMATLAVIIVVVISSSSSGIICIHDPDRVVVVVIVVVKVAVVGVVVVVSDLNEPTFPALKHLKHSKLSLRKPSQNIFHNLYKTIIKIRFIVLDC